MLLVPPAIVALVTHRYGTALLLMVIAGASDVLDGFLARRFGWETRLGSILDPMADKLLLVSSYLTLAWLGPVPVWLAIVVIGRDAVIVGGAVAYHYLIDPVPMAPTILSKLNTLAQTTQVIVVVATLYRGIFADGFLHALVWLVALTTAGSGIQYVYAWSLRARRQRTGRA